MLATCALIKIPAVAISVMALIRESQGHLRLVLDEAGAPCARELAAHRPHAIFSRKTHKGRIPREVYTEFMRVINLNACRKIVRNHDGAVRGRFGADLYTAARRLGLEGFMKRDEKWVSLAKRAHHSSLWFAEEGIDQLRDLIEQHLIDVVVDPEAARHSLFTQLVSMRSRGPSSD